MAGLRQKYIQLVLVFSLFILSGCSTKEDISFVHSIFQTNGAASIRKHTDILQNSLIKYYIKLNKRNPNNTSKANSTRIISEIQNRTNRLRLTLLHQKKILSYQDYLNIAFSKDFVKNRNDYLILGIYKMLYNAYTFDRSHTITAVQHDTQRIQEANKMMQVIQYKIQKNKDKDGNYLFITWQRAWQIESLKKISKQEKMILDQYTQNELLYHSNMNFQIITQRMIFTLQETLHYLGEEGTNLSAQAIKSVFIFL